jgi:hypothetical protein
VKLARLARILALAIALVLPSCSRDQPAAPTLHSLSGHVRLTGFLVDAGGTFAGTRVVGDADGVRVDLLYGNRVVGSTLTKGGVYRFTGLGPGGYVARTRVVGDVGDDTEILTIANADVSANDTLRVVSVGDIYPVPNPVGSSTGLYFVLPDTEVVAVRILDPAGNVVRNLRVGQMAAGLNLLIWDVNDIAGHPVTGSLYWATLVAGTDVRAQLLFR